MAGWWPELARWRPQRLWISYWHLHHIEALVATRRPCLLDPLSTALLHLLAGPAPVAVVDLPARLRLESSVVARLFQGLAETGLATTEGGRWLLTPMGRLCLESRVTTVPERRSFHFLDRAPLQQAPHFLPLVGGATTPLDAGAEWHFDPGALAACVPQPPEWKVRYHFPRDVEAVLLPEIGNYGRALPWQRVVFDRPEQVCVLMAEVPAEVSPSRARLIACEVQPQGWVLRPTPVVLELGPEWEEVFPDLYPPLAAEAWMQGWRAWCQPRALPPAEVDACDLAAAGCVLQVRAPRALLDRLRGSRSEANKPEPWLLAGSGRARALARLEIVEKG
jgi:hypothetical protein